MTKPLSESRAREEGREAAEHGRHPTANPYPLGTTLSRAWNLGHRDALGTKQARSIVEQISHQTGISVNDILGDARFQHIVDARHKVIAMMHRQGFSASKIGRMLQRDHSSILSSLRRSRCA